MITKLDIQEKDGFLTMKDFPMNCIFNKVKTGCGATTIALTNNENYIITVPTTELIENKCYPTKDADGNVKFWKKHERRAGLSPVVNNLFGLYGNFTLELKKKLKDYLSSVGVKKIICTYDKIDKLMEFINPKDFKLTINNTTTSLNNTHSETRLLMGCWLTLKSSNPIASCQLLLFQTI